MATPLVAGAVLEDAALELKLQTQRENPDSEAAARAVQLHRVLSKREVFVRAGISLIRHHYIPGQMLRDYPWLAGEIFTPPVELWEMEKDDAA